MKAHKMTKATLTRLAGAALVLIGGLQLTAAFAADAAANAALSNSASVVAAPGQSAMPQQPVTLEEYLRLVVRNQPSLAADRLETGLARADTTAASAFPNPTLQAYGKPG